MNFSRKAGVAFVAALAMLLGLTLPALAAKSERFWLCDLPPRAVAGQYNLSSAQLRSSSVIVDSAMTREEALGDAVVPPEGQAIHAQMKPLLCVLPVVYRGYDGKIHLGQVVVHEYVAPKVARLFARMFMGFPIKSVIPQSKFSYNDQASMVANNTMSYRPEGGSVHAAAAAFDINPFQNPFDRTRHDPPSPIEPAGAVYDITAKGTIVKAGDVRKAWTAEHFEWGGGWGDPDATPPTDYWVGHPGYFDYQHFQPDYTWYESFYRDHVPSGVMVYRVSGSTTMAKQPSS